MLLEDICFGPSFGYYHLFIHPSIHQPSAHQSTCPSTHSSICPFNHLPHHLPTHLPNQSPMHLLIYPLIHPSISIVTHFKYLLCSSCESSTLLLQEETMVNISLTWQRNKLLHYCEINTTIKVIVGCTWVIWYGQETL